MARERPKKWQKTNKQTNKQTKKKQRERERERERENGCAERVAPKPHSFEVHWVVQPVPIGGSSDWRKCDKGQDPGRGWKVETIPLGGGRERAACRKVAPSLQVGPGGGPLAVVSTLSGPTRAETFLERSPPIRY